MSQQSQQSIDRQVQQNIGDDRDDDRKHQRMSVLSSRTGDNSSERSVKRIRDRDDELNKPGATARRQQRQQKPQSEQRVDQKENVIDYL